MEQTYTITMSKGEFNQIIKEAVEFAVETKLKISHPDDLLTTAQACDYLNCSSVFLWKLRKNGKLNSLGAGRKIYYRRTELDRFMNSHQTQEVES